MIDIHLIKKYFPKDIRENAIYYKYMLKEYIQLLILDYLSNSPHIKKLSFIGGTNLRLVMGIDRFSEDIDFDCKNLSEEEFIQMTDDILIYLQRNGYQVESRDNKNKKLKAFRRSIYFPEFLFDLGLSGHRTERFLIKIEGQDQLITYKTVLKNIKGCGFFFPFPVPSDEIMCSMKLSALLSRSKGRDFYDTMFLLGFTKPDYAFLSKKMGIKSATELKKLLDNLLDSINLNSKSKDFEHLLFNKHKNKQILHFREFVNDTF